LFRKVGLRFLTRPLLNPFVPLIVLVLALVLVLDSFSAVRKNPSSLCRWALSRSAGRHWSGISSTIDNENENEDEDDWKWHAKGT
jgi:hypothetical protein